MRTIHLLGLTLAVSAGLAIHAQETRFTLTLTVNSGGAPAVAWRGQPVLAEVLLTLEAGDVASVALRDGAAWADAVRLETRNERGEAVAASWTPIRPSPGTMSFTADAPEATAVFVLDPNATTQLTAGAHTLRAVFDTQSMAATGAWQGKVESTPVPLAVRDDTGTEATVAERVDRGRLRARWLSLTGRSAEALAELEALATAWPRNISVLTDQAEMLAELGRADEAQETVQTALRAFRATNPNATHPPRFLLRLMEELRPSPQD